MTADLERAAPPQIESLVENLVSLMRSFGKARARMIAAAEHDIEWSAYLLLRCIANSGEPRRAAELADALQSDPSTVSRQVAALVRDGHLERRADPADGRASLLALTPQGQNLLAEHDRIRLEHFARVVDGWSHADVKRLVALLERFNRDYATVNTDWMDEQITVARSGRAGSRI
jgi:DNA-binding MarR family transcriptional regulator